MNRDEDGLPDPRLTGLTAGFVAEVRSRLDDGDVDRIRDLAEPLGHADLADLLESLDTRERGRLVQAIRGTFDPTVLTELDDSVRLEVVEQFDTVELAAAIANLESDDALYLIETLDDVHRIAVMQAMPAAFRAILEQGLAYPESSAGRLMQRDVVAVPGFWTVGETIDFLRRSQGLPDDFYDLFVVDPAHRPIGTVPTSRVLRNPRETRIADIMEDRGLGVPADMDQEQVADIFRRNDLVSVPVVDAAGRLVGAITVDDIVDVIDEEAEEDLLGLARTGERDIYASPLRTARRRQSWLLITLVNTILASIVISRFEGAIQEIVALAVLMPIVAAMGGNAGMQVITVMVRALAARDLVAGGTWRVIGKEVVVGVMNGLVFATVMGTIATLWFGDLSLGLVLASAMMFNMVWAGLAGTVIPLTLDRFDIDPAVAAGPFLTTTTDVLGFFVFLGLASTFLL
ncbi:magnesium transporter [Skermanella stibiiresistens SB22]|uniref:Magnesium transporter MgtE n=1 Tax=Skermanella stibiiresistens SB22 TaxID=1385369 RepID=W9H9P9_9PROT|nr:magnesium transporter [Skermanella stibiiresistens]EWY42649.1 magnesium transporter [Skermanella stibiiresistens SB22]